MLRRLSGLVASACACLVIMFALPWQAAAAGLPEPTTGKGDGLGGVAEAGGEAAELRAWLAGTWRTLVAYPGQGEIEIVTVYDAAGRYAATSTVIFPDGSRAPNPASASGGYEVSKIGERTLLLSHRGVGGTSSQLEIVDGATLLDRASGTRMVRIER